METTFATQKNRMWLTRIRNVGLVKAAGRQTLAAIAFNIRGGDHTIAASAIRESRRKACQKPQPKPTEQAKCCPPTLIQPIPRIRATGPHLRRPRSACAIHRAGSGSRQAGSADDRVPGYCHQDEARRHLDRSGDGVHHAGPGFHRRRSCCRDSTAASATAASTSTTPIIITAAKATPACGTPREMAKVMTNSVSGQGISPAMKPTKKPSQSCECPVPRNACHSIHSPIKPSRPRLRFSSGALGRRRSQRHKGYRVDPEVKVSADHMIRKVTIESALPVDAFSLALDDAGYAATAA